MLLLEVETLGRCFNWALLGGKRLYHIVSKGLLSMRWYVFNLLSVLERSIDRVREDFISLLLMVEYAVMIDCWVSNINRAASEFHFLFFEYQLCTIKLSLQERSPLSWSIAFIIEYWIRKHHYCWVSNIYCMSNSLSINHVEYQLCLQWFLEYQVDPISASACKIVEYPKLIAPWFHVEK